MSDQQHTFAVTMGVAEAKRYFGEPVRCEVEMEILRYIDRRKKNAEAVAKHNAGTSIARSYEQQIEWYDDLGHDIAMLRHRKDYRAD